MVHHLPGPPGNREVSGGVGGCREEAVWGREGGAGGSMREREYGRRENWWSSAPPDPKLHVRTWSPTQDSDSMPAQEHAAYLNSPIAGTYCRVTPLQHLTWKRGKKVE